ncbi:protein mono-ADP-ribosyltransferase PARP12-like [Haliotis rufescens]|uniref:protein mono-ADP-ribosyltransferase PARP12-like n=1 Tax=Haliotis rufescens TaxID=6454 RepID=UPI00201EB0A1|nr:protein mono-ADP-ribosyltransferase PARP12-like [Haliotis rufescens]
MASNDEAATLVMTVLSRCNCRTSLQQLIRHLTQDGFKIKNEKGLMKFLEKYPNVFQIVRTPNPAASIVFLYAPVPICEDHSTKKGNCTHYFCGNLHICKFFLLSDSCKFESKCAYGHDLQTRHNLQVLQPFLMDRLSTRDIKIILRCIENRTFLTKPELCRFYNTIQGCNKATCPFLHLCGHYMSDACKFGNACKRSHNINDPHVTSILDKYGIITQRPEHIILQDLRSLFATFSEGPLARHSSVTSLPESTQPPTKGPRSRSVGPKQRNRRVSSPSPARSDSYDIQDQYGNHGYGNSPPNMHPPQGLYGYGTQGGNPPFPDDQYSRPPRNPGYPPSHCYEPHGQYTSHLPPNVLPNPFGRPTLKQGQPISYHQEPQGPRMQGHESHGGRPRAGMQEPLHPNPGQRNEGARPKSYQKTRSSSRGRPSYGKQVSEASDKDTLDICTYFLKGKCWYGQTCMRHHKEMIYQWQCREKQGPADCPQDWKDFDEESNTNIEMNFCQPDKNECFGKLDDVINISFIDDPMTGTRKDSQVDIRRLSTLSSEDESATSVVHQWITEWKWYWETQYGDWTEYGVKDFRGFTSSMDSEAIEKAYLADPKGSIEFKTDEFCYKLNFSVMIQENTKLTTTRRVRRRPYFYKKADLKKRNMTPSSDNVVVPDEWSSTKFKSPKELYAHFSSPKVGKSTEEYKKVEDLFFKTLPRTKVIKSISRIENGALWVNYSVKMAQMNTKAGKPVKELSLFHGTLLQLVDPICHQGFDFRFSGARVGTKHGRGSYFARDAKYSHAYSKLTDSPNPAELEKKMFVAKVLVGESTTGNPTYVRPPAKSSQNGYELYDSCVDNTSDPSIYVIFTLEQSYPEYLISYV